jgi:negative regulator of genetic competence, sporulation and motility
MQYPIEVQGTYTQTIQTIHPDILTVVKFSYTATVKQNEMVIIKSVFQVDGNYSFEIRIKPNGEYDTAMQRFLAAIREHARENAYAQHKAALVKIHNQITRAIKQ